MTMFDQPDLIDPWARGLLARHGLDSFEALWGLDAPWFEEPNRRRGGWSGVVRVELEDETGGRHGLFIKRQEDHPRRDLLHPFGEPTFAAELRSLLRTREAGVATLEPVWYQQRRVDGHLRAVLITRELMGFRPLNLVVRGWAEGDWPATRPQRGNRSRPCRPGSEDSTCG